MARDEYNRPRLSEYGVACSNLGNREGGNKGKVLESDQKGR